MLFVLTFLFTFAIILVLVFIFIFVIILAFTVEKDGPFTQVVADSD